MSRPTLRILVPLVLSVLLLVAVLVVRWVSGQDEARLGSARLNLPSRQSLIQATPPSSSPPAIAGRPASLARVRTLDVMKLLGTYADKYRLARKESSAGGILRFCYEEVLHIREARLLALACPDLAEKHATALALDTTADNEHRRYATFVLGALAKNGDKSAEATLYQVSCGKDDPIIEEALRMLSEADGQGEYRTLYWTKCREAHESAFYYATYWEDVSTRQLMRELTHAPSDRPSPEGSMGLSARYALERLDILAASSTPGQGPLYDMLENPAHRMAIWFPWALRAAAARNLPGLDAILRRRLDRVETALANQIRIGEPPWQDPFVKDGNIGASGGDKFLDDVLLACGERGGKLTELETRRLRYFGYFCDPMERLLELLAEQGTDH